MHSRRQRHEAESAGPVPDTPPSPKQPSSSSSGVFPFRLNRRKTLDDRINFPLPFKSSSSSAASSTRDAGLTDASASSSKNRIRDIFAIPSHKPTGVAEGSHAISDINPLTSSDDTPDDDDDDLTSPRVGRPPPTRSPVAPISDPFARTAPPPLAPIPGASKQPLTTAFDPHWTNFTPRPPFPPAPTVNVMPPPHQPPVSLVNQPTMSQPPAYTPSPPLTKPNKRNINPQTHNPPGDASTTADSSSATPPPQGRFPRWRGWLEKRALERHLERISVTDPDDQEAMRRKKSWGAGIHDADAISEDEAASRQEEEPFKVPPPLHSHQFGSRFLPHLPTQPLCAVYLQVPYPQGSTPNLNLRRNPNNSMPSRSVLLIGTADGLFAVEHRRRPQQDQQDTASASSHGRDQSNNGWNQDIRCTQIWKGLSVYQLCILQPSDRPTESPSSSISSIPFLGSRAATETPNSGIVLGLCTDSAKKSYSRPSTMQRLSSHTNTAVEYASSTLTSASSSSLGHAHPGPSSNRNSQILDDPFSSTSFGPGAGGGIGKPVPPGSAGIVKMWNLEAVRKVVAYVVNEQAHPLDLSPSSRSKTSGALNGALRLPAVIRGAWASLAEPRNSSSSAAEKRRSRRAESDSYGVASPYRPPSPSSAAYAGRASQPRSNTPRSSSRRSSRDAVVSPTSRGSTESSDSWRGTGATSPLDNDSAHATEKHAQALRLAQAHVSINASTGTLSHQGRQSSDIPSPLQTLFGDEASVSSTIRPVTSRDSHATSIGGASSAAGHGTSGSAAGSSSSSHGKGCLFFAVYESPLGFKAPGTWYLALASSRGILVYEAAPSRKSGGSRTWSFLKELYTPLPPKGMAFVPASTATRDPSQASARPTHSRMSSSSKFALVDEHSRGAGGADRGSRHMRSGTAPSPSVLMPQHGLGSAGPAAWNGADLSLFVSFGRRAVMIRLSDAHVREIDLASTPLPLQNPSSTAQQHAGTAGEMGPPLPPAPHESVKSHHRKRPSSESGRILLAAATSNAASGHHSGSMGSGASDRNSVKASKTHQYWTGLQHVEARLTVRQDSEEVLRSRGSQYIRPTLLPTSSDPPVGSIPMMPSNSDSAAERRQVRPLVIDDEDSSDDTDSDYDAADANGITAGSEFPGVTLHDRSVRIRHRGSASDPNIVSNANEAMAAHAARTAAPASVSALGAAGTDPRSAQQQQRQRPEKLRTAVWSPRHLRSNTFQLSANVTLVSRGTTTHILPYPLPADMVSPPTLEVLHWSDVPKAVTGWSRILGVEQTMSTGPLTMTAMKRDSRLGTLPAGGSSPTAASIRLKLSLTAMAFLQYRVEMKRVTVDVNVARPLGMEPNVELHLCPPPGPEGGDTGISTSPQGQYQQQQQGPILDSSLRPSLSEERNSTTLDLEYPTSFVLAASHVGGCTPRTLLGDESGPTPSSSSRHKSLSANAPSGRGYSPYDAAGDGGAWCFSYKGGEDYRIEYFGAEV